MGPGARGARWRRQHDEIVSASGSDPERAEALLREHLAEFGCDPVATTAVQLHLGSHAGDRLRDLRCAGCCR
jgi:hypothetical protein